MTSAELGIAGAVAVAAGFVNALAGGGTLISFPTLMALGVPPINANITNTVALCPGFFGAALAQRRDLQGQARRIWTLVPAAALGGLAGGVLLLNSSERGFRSVVPFLILGASALLAAQEHVRAWIVRRHGAAGAHRAAARAAAPIGVAAVYGGYFGAGLSVIVLATLGVLIDDTLTRLNALKQMIAMAANLAALLLFVFSGHVVWPLAIVMAAGALLGGALGGKLARMVAPATLRRAVVIVGVAVGILYLM